MMRDVDQISIELCKRAGIDHKFVHSLTYTHTAGETPSLVTEQYLRNAEGRTFTGDDGEMAVEYVRYEWRPVGWEPKFAESWGRVYEGVTP